MCMCMLEGFKVGRIRFEPHVSHAALWVPPEGAARLSSRICITVLVAGPLQMWRDSFRNDARRVPLATWMDEE